MYKKPLLINLVLALILFTLPLPAQAQSPSFGGVKLSGVLSAGISCAANIPAVKDELNKLKTTAFNAIGSAAEAIPVVGKFVSSLFKSASGGQAVYDSKVETHLKFLENKEKCLDKVAYSAATGVLNQMTQKTLNWANKGFGGNPLYVRDIDSYLTSIANEKIGRFLQGAPGADSVFGNTIRSLITQEATGKVDGLIGKLGNTPQAKQYQNFQEDFTNGGWSALLNPSYNSLEAVFNASDNLSQQLATQEKNIRDEVNRNNGFLDMKQCAEWANNGQVKDPTTGEPVCLRWETVTPGAIIAEQVSAVTQAPIDKITQADELNEILQGLFDSFMNKLFTKGIASLKGGDKTTFSSGGPGVNAVLGSDGKPLASITENFYDTSGEGVTDFDISRPQLLRAISQAQANYINRAKDSQIALVRLIPRMGILDYCLPGPNPTWMENLDNNYQVFTAAPTKDSERLYGFLVSGPWSLLSKKVDQVDTTGLSFLDKVSGTEQRLSGRKYKLEGSFNFNPFTGVAGFIRMTSKVKPDDFMKYMEEAVNSLINDYSTKFSQRNLTDAFVATASTPADQLYARGFVGLAYGEASNLTAYTSMVPNLNQQYADEISLTQTSYAELESIRQEVNSIVGTAKARYIAEQKAAGTPVNQQCIDAAYKIDTSPIVPVARQESDTRDPILDQSDAAATYFYNNL